MADTASDAPALRSVEDFLKWIESQDERFEFDGFRLVAMTGGTTLHSRIIANVITALGAALRGKPRAVYSPDSLVRIDSAHGFYPDVTVSWSSEPRSHLERPVVIVEALSESTERRDRGHKWHQYRRIPTLRHYPLVAQDRIAVDHFHRSSPDEEWRAEVLEDRAESLRLDAIEAGLKVAEIYEGVELDDET